MSNHAKKTMDTAKAQAAIKAAREGMEQEKQLADIIAEVRRIHYEAAIKKGFTPAEALFLCRDGGGKFNTGGQS